MHIYVYDSLSLSLSSCQPCSKGEDMLLLGVKDYKKNGLERGPESGNFLNTSAGQNIAELDFSRVTVLVTDCCFSLSLRAVKTWIDQRIIIFPPRTCCSAGSFSIAPCRAAGWTC